MISCRWIRGLTLRILYPLLILTGSLSKKRKESYQRFFINLNNRLVKREKFRTKNILLLLPHCLQIDECNNRITYNIYNCERCGKCKIKDLIEIADNSHLNLFVATGGSLAKRIVHEVKPEAVVAVACENDLSSGIVDTYPLPVLGIPNERPFGPCLNTRVDLEKIKDAIGFFSNNNEK